MNVVGVTCALTLSIIAGGYQLEWNEHGPAAAAHLRNHPSALAEAAFVSEAVAAGVAAGTMRQCAKGDLRCILPLGVAFNAARKRRLIWDGRHVNKNLVEVPFVMETLQRQGRTLFEPCSWGGTCDLQNAYHHIEMHPDSIPFLGFEWEGAFYAFVVLPFGLSTAPRIFTLVLANCVRFLRHRGIRLMSFLDDLIFAHSHARGAVSAGQQIIEILGRFGWLIHPSKCTGTHVAIQAFTALGVWVDLAKQTFSIPADKLARIRAALRELRDGPALVPVRAVARVKGLLSSTWLSTGTVTRVRTRGLDAVIDSRPKREGERCPRSSWRGSVSLGADCLAELDWWLGNLDRVNGSAIRPRAPDGRFDGCVFSDASDTGAGAVLLVDGPEAAASALIEAFRAHCPVVVSAAAARDRLQAGLEFVFRFHAGLSDESSTLRELWGVAEFVDLACRLLAGGRHRLVMDNLGGVLILGGFVPPFAVGGKTWGEYVSGGSPKPALQALARRIFDAQDEHGFVLVPEWRPREQNVRADYLSHVSEMRHHGYRLRARLFAQLDAVWGPHTVDRFASVGNQQSLAAPHAGRFCSHYFQPEAEWTDAFTTSWAGEDNWCFPPVPRLAECIVHLRQSRARGTIVAPASHGWAPWWGLVHSGAGWSRDVVATRDLGAARSCLLLTAEYRALFRDGNVLAIRMDCR